MPVSVTCQRAMVFAESSQRWGVEVSPKRETARPLSWFSMKTVCQASVPSMNVCQVEMWDFSVDNGK